MNWSPKWRVGQAYDSRVGVWAPYKKLGAKKDPFPKQSGDPAGGGIRDGN